MLILLNCFLHDFPVRGRINGRTSSVVKTEIGENFRLERVGLAVDMLRPS